MNHHVYTWIFLSQFEPQSPPLQMCTLGKSGYLLDISSFTYNKENKLKIVYPRIVRYSDTTSLTESKVWWVV